MGVLPGVQELLSLGLDTGDVGQDLVQVLDVGAFDAEDVFAFLRWHGSGQVRVAGDFESLVGQS